MEKTGPPETSIPTYPITWSTIH